MRKLNVFIDFKLNHHQPLFIAYTTCFFVFTSIRIGVYSYVLRIIRKGTQNKFATRVVSLFLLSDVCELVTWGLAFELTSQLQEGSRLTSGTIALIVLTTITYFLTYLCFDTATWYFCYHYFQCSVKLGFVKDHKPFPLNFEWKQKILLWVLMGVNVLVVTSYTVVNSTYAIRQARNPPNYSYPWLLTTNLFLQGFVQFLSYIFLLYGLLKIRKFL